MTKTEKPFFHDDKRCKGCIRVTHFVDKGGRKDKWLCFGRVTRDYDSFRFCIKHPPKPIEEKGLFKMSMTKEETKAFILGLLNLL